MAVLQVARLAPMQVGAVLWHSDGPRLTAIVKATFKLDHKTGARLASTQRPLWLDGPEQGGEVLWATDFVPRKPVCDVLLVGHARAEEPSTAIDVGIRVGGWTKRVTAVSDAAQRAIPLRVANLRTGGADGAPARLAPRHATTPEWAQRRLPAGFDFECFNTAPPDQRLDDLPAGLELELEGLDTRCCGRFQLPGTVPSVFFAADRDAAWRQIFVRCDTLWVDADHALCTLTFRGDIGVGVGDASFLIVGVGEESDLQQQLSWAKWSVATTEDQLQDDDDAPDPTAATTLGRSRSRKHKVTLGIDKNVQAKPVLPFTAAPPDSGDADGRATLTGDNVATGPSETLPFKKPSAALPPHVARAVESLDPAKRGATASIEADAQPSDPLPFDKNERE